MSETFDLVRSPRLSIVIPTPADTAAMEETLVSVLEHRPDDCEIVVALGCDYADPWNIREEVRFVQAPAGSSLVACVNLGVAASEGEVVHVLAAGWRATEGWTDLPLERFEDEEVGAVVPLGVAADDRDRVVSAGVRCAVGGRRIDVAADTRWKRTRAAECPPAGASVPQGPVLETGFWRADVLALAGRGFTTACGDAAADADMAITLARSGRRVVLEPHARVVASAAARPRSGAFAAGLHAERLFWRSVAGSSFLPALVMHLVEIVRHAVVRAPLGTVPMLVGRVVALLQFGGYVPRYLQLRRVVRQAMLARQAAADGGRGQGEAAKRPTIRIDGPQAGLGRPRQRVERESAPLRKSA
ncbi:MAG: glycosyltransferase family 2 protein [Planctomycetia bacterium]